MFILNTNKSSDKTSKVGIFQTFCVIKIYLHIIKQGAEEKSGGCTLETSREHLVVKWKIYNIKTTNGFNSGVVEFEHPGERNLEKDCW